MRVFIVPIPTGTGSVPYFPAVSLQLVKLVDQVLEILEGIRF